MFQKKFLKPQPRGPHVDEYDCFLIEDFERGDSIRVRHGRTVVKAVVIAVYFGSNIIQYRIKDGTTGKATINDIVSLEPQIKNWLA